MRRQPLLSFGILWFFGHLAVESTIIPLDLVYEHRLYLPSAIPLVLLSGLLLRGTPASRAGTLVLVALIGLLGTWTVQRNQVWESKLLFWQDNAAKAPNKARVQANLGKAYLDAKDYKAAQRAFERALALDPMLLGVYNNLAFIQMEQPTGDLGLALRLLGTALSRDASFAGARINLGVIHLRLGRYQEAAAELEKGLESVPATPTLLYYLSAAHFNARGHNRALEILERGTSLWPGDAKLEVLLGMTYLELGRVSEAEAALRRGLEVDPGDEMGRAALARLRDIAGKRVRARR